MLTEKLLLSPLTLKFDMTEEEQKEYFDLLVAANNRRLSSPEDWMHEMYQSFVSSTPVSRPEED